MTSRDPKRQIFYPTLTRIIDSFSCSTLFLFIFYLYIYLYLNKLLEVPEYAKMQFHMMTSLGVLGKIAWVRYDFLTQGKISDILIRCARKYGTYLKITYSLPKLFPLSGIGYCRIEAPLC